jgi:hypothetical protein
MKATFSSGPMAVNCKTKICNDVGDRKYVKPDSAALKRATSAKGLGLSYPPPLLLWPLLKVASLPWLILYLTPPGWTFPSDFFLFPPYVTSSYLDCRTFQTFFWYATSTRCVMRAGVSQGGLVSPVLFRLCVNDVPTQSRSKRSTRLP